MKLFLFFAVLIVGGVLYCLNDFSNVSTPILAHIQQQEGTAEAVQQASQQDGFAAKYKGFLDERYDLSRLANVMDDGAMMALCTDTYSRYNNTPLQTDPEFGFMLVHRALLLDDQQKFQDATDLFEQYLTLFPQGDSVAVARSAVFSLRVNHGAQVNN